MSNFSFGASTGAPMFKVPATTAAPAFGTTPTLNFGAPAASTAPAFGAATQTGLGTGSFSFGVPAAAPTLGAATTTAPPAFGFGNTTSTAATTTLQTSTAAPAFSFNTGALGGTNLNAATSAASTVPTLGGLGGNFSFAKTIANTTTTTGLTFGQASQQGNAFGLNKPLGIAAPSVAATTTTTAAATPFVGLGGLDVSASQPKPGDNKSNNFKVKESVVPDEIAKTVESLKGHIKTQKQLSSDIGRTSTSRLANVSGEISKLQWILQEISNSVETNHNQIKLLRNETSKTVQSLEMAQRTQDTPAGLQYENQAPFQYFQDLVAKYEQDLINIRQQIALTERHMQSITNPQTVTPDDLKRGLQQINECFVSLAGRVHEVHQKVETQKEQFLNLRKYRLRDNSNVFAKLEAPTTETSQSSSVIAGPSPFPHFSAMDSFGRSFATNSAAAGAVNK